MEKLKSSNEPYVTKCLLYELDNAATMQYFEVYFFEKAHDGKSLLEG